MTGQQAKSLYYLSSFEQWKSFIAYKQARLQELYLQLESCNEASLKTIQGQILEIKRDLRIRDTAEDVLSAEERK